MAKPEWGTKRVCQSCGARFYDLGRSPIVCPACGAVFDLELLNRARRARPAPRVAAVAAPDGDLVGEEAEIVGGGGGELEEAEDDVEAEEETAVEEEDEAQEEEDGLIEDASELGEDEDMSDVIEGGLDEEEPR